MAQSLDNLSRTWSDSGTTFTAIKYSVTDTASAAGSNLLELRGGAAGTTSLFKVDKAGNLTTAGVTLNFGTGGSYAVLQAGGTSYAQFFNSFFTALRPFSLSNDNDTIITRDAANTLAQRNGTNAQAFRIYNTYTTASDYERLEMYWASNIAYVVPTAAGAGTQRNLYIGGSTTKHIRFLPSTNQIDVYPDGGLSVRFTSTSIELGWNIGGSRDITLQPQTGNTNRDSNSLTITADNGVGSGTAGFFRVLSGVVGPSGTAAHALEEVVRHYVIATGEPMASFGGTTSSFPALKRDTVRLQARLADDSAFTNIQGKLTTETAYTAGAPTATGYLVLYDSNGTAYKVPAEAL